MQNSNTLDQVKEYYGQVLESSEDLKTGACCSIESIPDYQKEILKDIHDEVLARFYGCGSPIPQALEGATVLDLGCGTGRDAYMVSKLAGPNGFVIGLDMTDEQLEIAEKYRDYHTSKFGYSAPNTEFRKGYIEDLAESGLEDNSVDVVISNCVINLSPNKDRVLEEIFRVLKPGGELYFSDVFSDRRVPSEVAADSVVYGECLGGAMYLEDFRRKLNSLGCQDYRIVSRSPIEVTDPAVKAVTGNLKFESVTIRAFKLESLEDICEDYGQVAYYKGGITESPDSFTLDDHHYFEKGRPVLVCGNTAAMLEDTRFSKYFNVVGDRSVHYGPFDCAPDAVGAMDESSGGACC